MTEGSDATWGAVDIDRLPRDLLDARDEIAATNDVLTAMGRSASDLDLVLGTIVDRALHLCRADGVQLHLADGLGLTAWPVRRVCPPTSGIKSITPFHATSARSSVGWASTRARRRSPTCSPILATVARMPSGLRDIAPSWVRRCCRRRRGRVLSSGAPEVDPFEDRAIAAAPHSPPPAAIAFRNFDLVRALEARSVELGHKVTNWKHSARSVKPVSSSLDLDMVLSTIVAHAVQLSGTDGGSLMEFDETQQLFFVRTAYGTSDEVLDKLRQAKISLHHTFVGRGVLGSAVAAGGRHAWAELGRSPATAPRRRLAFDGGCTDAPRGSHRWCSRGPKTAWRRLPRRRRASCCRPSRASQRWQS